MIYYKTNYGEATQQLKSLVLPKLNLLFDKARLKEKLEYDIIVNNGVCTFYCEEGQRLHHWPEFEDFLTFVRKHLEIYCKENNDRTDMLPIRSMWANKYDQYSFVKPHQHTHNDDIISVTFYIEKPEKSGNFHLCVPTDNIPEEHYIELLEGDILIFPSYYMHWADPNLNTKEKIMIAIDFIKGKENV